MSEKYYGLYQGIVTNIKDPEKRGRIKVKCPVILGIDVESAWCDPLVTVAYDNGGDFCIPTKDEMVWLQFIAGDVNKPVYMGGWWQKNMTPLGNNYEKADQVRIINYADCTIVMQNGKIDINTNSGTFDLRIEDGKLSVNGDLTVSGIISAKNIKAEEDITALNTIKAQSITATGDSGVVTASRLEVSRSVTAQSLSVTTISAEDISADNVTVDSVSADSVSATSVTADSITANGVSLAEHTHGGVQTGLYNTDKPN